MKVISDSAGWVKSGDLENILHFPKSGSLIFNVFLMQEFNLI